jgi:hypothetical protein
MDDRDSASRNRVVIREEGDATHLDAGFSIRHPEIAYLFGDTVRALYVVGCLAVALFVMVQVHLSLPSLDVLLLPPLGVGFAALAYVELRLYRLLWPASRSRQVRELVEGRDR